MARLRSYLILSLLCHFLLLFLLRIPYRDFQKNVLAEPIWIDIQKGKYEVVDILPPEREARPDQAEFLGLYDSKTKEQKVAAAPLQKPNRKAEPKPSEEKGWGSAAEIVPQPETLVPEEYHPDFRHGPHTYLNVLRFPDIQYFVRLKRAFKMTFNPLSPLQEAYFHNRITRGRIETVLAVSIDKEGNLAELFVLRNSGLETYDQEALRTIRASSPFSAPPGKLLNGEGMLRMSWTFTVYL